MLAGSTDAVGVDVAFGVLPAALQDDDGLGLVASGDGFLFAEARGIDALVGVGHEDLVVESQGFRTAGEGYAHVHLRIGVGGRFDGLNHFAGEYGAAHDYVDIYDAGGLAVLIFAHELGAFAMTGAGFGIDSVGCLGDACGLGQNVGCAPW